MPVNEDIVLNGDSEDLREALGLVRTVLGNLLGQFDDLDGHQLGEVEKQAKKAEKGLERVQRSFTKVRDVAQRVGSNLHNVWAGFQLVRGGVDLARNALESYFRTSEAGEAMWADVERTLRRITAQFVELFLGTDDLEEGFERIVSVVDDMVAVMEAVFDVAQPVVDLLRNAFTGALGVAANAARTFSALLGGSRDAMEGFGAEVVDQSNEILEAAENAYGSTTQGQIEDMVSGLEDLAYQFAVAGLEASGLDLSRGEIEATAQSYASLAVEAGELNSSIVLLNESGESVSTRWGRHARVIEDFAAQAEDAGETAAILPLVFAEANAELEAFEAEARESARTTEELTEEIDDSADSMSSYASSIEDVVKQFENLAQAQAIYENTAADLAAPEFERLAEGQERKLEAVFEYFEEIAEAEAKLADEQARAQAERDREFEEQRREATERWNERARQAAEEEARRLDQISIAVGDVAGAYNELITSAVEGEEVTGKMIRNVIADALLAKGTEALATAPIVAFDITKGGPPAAAGLAGAGAAAIGIASAIRSGGGGDGAVGAGLAPPTIGGASVQSFTTDNSRSLNVYGNVVGDPRQLASLADDMDRAQQQYGGV